MNPRHIDELLTEMLTSSSPQIRLIARFTATGVESNLRDWIKTEIVDRHTSPYTLADTLSHLLGRTFAGLLHDTLSPLVQEVDDPNERKKLSTDIARAATEELLHAAIRALQDLPLHTTIEDALEARAKETEGNPVP